MSSARPHNIVVWEWEDDLNNFVAYEPNVSNEIEDANQNHRPTPFVISVKVPAVQTLIRYEIDPLSLIQRNQKTGVIRGIRRSILSASSGLANGYAWEWEEFKPRSRRAIWQPYATEFSEEIEATSHRNIGATFTFPSKYNMPYDIDFKTMTQKNLNTNFKRRIRRRQLSGSYKCDCTMQKSHLNATGMSLQSSATNTTYPVGPLATTSTSMPVGTSLATDQIQTSSFPVAGTIPSITSLNSISAYGSQSITQAQTRLYSSPPHGGSAYQGSSLYSNSPLVPSVNSQGDPNLIAGLSITDLSKSAPTGGSKRKWKRKSVPWKPCPPAGINCTFGGSATNVPVAHVISSFTKKIQVAADSTDQCLVCQSDLTDESGFGNSKDTVELNLCKHIYHLECIEATYSHGVQNGCIVCPYCNKSHGVKTGDQPAGVMSYSDSNSSLPGYPGTGTVRIEYRITAGTQSSEHPNPGRHFGTPGFPRIAYLPNNDEGRSILYLLVEAWKRRLTFTVGRSSTTGRDDVVTWAGIHHKTSNNSHGSHGYPDPTYLDRVRDELEAAGVTGDD